MTNGSLLEISNISLMSKLRHIHFLRPPPTLWDVLHLLRQFSQLLYLQLVYLQLLLLLSNYQQPSLLLVALQHQLQVHRLYLLLPRLLALSSLTLQPFYLRLKRLDHIFSDRRLMRFLVFCFLFIES